MTASFKELKFCPDKAQAALSRTRYILGAEFFDDSVRLALLKDFPDKGILSLKDIPIKDMAEDEIAEAIGGVMKEIDHKISDTYLVLPANYVITKTLQIPSTKPEEIKDILSLQAGRHTPYSREELILDYINLGSFQNTYTKVFVVMVARDVVRKRLNTLEWAGLKVSKVLFSAEGLGMMAAQAMKPAEDAPPKAYVNIDEESCDFNVFSHDGLIFNRNIPVGMRHIKEDRENQLKRLNGEIKKSFESYNAEEISRPADGLFVTCKDDEWPVIEGALREGLSMGAKRFFIEEYIKVTGPGHDLATHAGPRSFAAVISNLAASRSLAIDLIPDEMKERRRLEARGRKMITIGILAMVIFFQICLFFVLKIYYTENYLERLGTKFQDKIDEADGLHIISERTRVIKNFLKGKGSPVKILASLPGVIPDEIYLKSVKIDDEGNAFIKGTSDSMSKIFELVTRLEGEEMYQGAKTEFTESRKDKGKDVSDFGITMTIER